MEEYIAGRLLFYVYKNVSPLFFLYFRKGGATDSNLPATAHTLAFFFRFTSSLGAPPGVSRKNLPKRYTHHHPTLLLTGGKNEREM